MSNSCIKTRNCTRSVRVKTKMDLFITKWEVIDKNTITILGFTSSNICIRIIDFRTYIYTTGQGKSSRDYRFIRGNRSANVVKKDFTNSKIMSKTKGYEDDIGVLIKFLSENQLDHIGWIRIKHYEESPENLRITTCKRELLISCKNIKNINNEITSIPNIKILSFDIECYTSSRGMSDARNSDDVIFMISMLFVDEVKNKKRNIVLSLGNIASAEYENYELICCKKEFELLEEFFNLIRTEDPDMIIGYNIMGFDMKYILQKYYCQLKNIPQAGRMLKDDFLKDNIINKSWNSSAYGIKECVIFNFVGRCCFDVYNYLTMEVTMQKYSLDHVSYEILGRRKIDLPYEEMFRKYERGEILDIAEYCYIDSDLTLEIWYRLGLWHAVVEQCKLYKVDIHDMYSSGQQKRIFNQLYFYAHDKNYVFDKESDFHSSFSYEGAYVLDPQPGIYKSCSVVDFASLYPSIIIAANICYTTLRWDDNNQPFFTNEHSGIIPEILKHLISSRKEIKKLAKQEDDVMLKSIYDKRQYAYKVCANSFYGAFGSRNSNYLQMISAAEKVTKNGRDFLRQVIEIINTHPYSCKVIYGDTDSCFFVGKEEALTKQQIQNIIFDINKSFPPPVHVEHEKDIDVMIMFAKKKYIYISEGKQCSKGVITARRDTCLWVRMIYKNLIDMILKDKNNDDANKYLHSEILKLYSNKIDLSMLATNKNLGISYKSKSYPLNIFKKILQVAENRDVHAGERLEYYYIRNTNTLQGYHYATKMMINKYNLKIDFRYYTDHQLSGPVVQLYKTLGWNFK